MARRGPSFEKALVKLLKGLSKMAERKAASTSQQATSDTDAYPVGLVGESHYQPAIAKLRQGDPVLLILEPDNPFDDCAIAAVDRRGNTIGYLPRDCWARRALLKENKGCTARVLSVRASNGGQKGVVIDLALDGPLPSSRRYQAGV